MLHSINLSDLFFWTGVVSTVLFVIKLSVFLITGGLSELTADFASITETDTSFNFFTVESLLSFFMGFGWVGLTFYKVWEMPIALSVFAGIAFGILFACLYAYLLINVKKLDESPKVKNNDYIGAQGKAYTNLAPHCEGQAELTINGKLSVIKVFNDTDEEISAFTPVKVVNAQDNKIFIEKSKNSNN